MSCPEYTRMIFNTKDKFWEKWFYLTSRYDTSVILHIILTNKVSLESQEDVDSIDINIFPITYYWAAETAIEPMYHIWYIGRERVKRKKEYINTRLQE